MMDSADCPWRELADDGFCSHANADRRLQLRAVKDAVAAGNTTVATNCLRCYIMVIIERFDRHLPNASAITWEMQANQRER
jgi:hypothetical protein